MHGFFREFWSVVADPIEGLKLAFLRPPSRIVPLSVGVCVLFAVAGLVAEGDSGKFFGEGKPGTLLSVLLLGLSAYASFKRARGGLPRRVRIGWLVFGVSLALAALDDMFKGHENADKMINGWLGLDPDGIAGKLDDILVLLYVIPAAVVMAWSWRSFFFREVTFFWRMMVAGLFFLSMVVFDIIDRDHLQWIEESSKVISGAFIFAAIVGTPVDGRPTDGRPTDRGDQLTGADEA